MSGDRTEGSVLPTSRPGEIDWDYQCARPVLEG
jgi:hypothetical protein